MKSWHYALFVFLGGCCFGVLSTFVKFAYANGFTTAEVVGSQFLFGLLIIWISSLFSKKKKLNIKQIVTVILSGIPMGLTGVFYYLSLQTLDASLAIVFLFQFVWIGTLFEWIIDKKVPTKGKLLSITILFVGSILASGYVTASVAVLPWQGVVWGILAAFSFSGFLFVSGAVGRSIPPIQKSTLLSTGAFGVILMLFPPFFLFDSSILIGIAPYGLFLGVFGVVLPPLLFSIGMPRVGLGLGTILSASELPVAVIMSAIVLTEVVNLLQWLGVMLILGGIVIGNAKFSNRKLNATHSTTS